MSCAAIREYEGPLRGHLSPKWSSSISLLVFHANNICFTFAMAGLGFWDKSGGASSRRKSDKVLESKTDITLTWKGSWVSGNYVIP